MNLIDQVESALAAHQLDKHCSVVPLGNTGPSDLAVVVRGNGDRSRVIEQARSVLSGCPEVAAVKKSGQRLLIRIEDTHMAEIGWRLEAGEEWDDLGNLLADRRYVVEFCDPNATKALHVGHLRNIAVGHALASAFSAAGAQVECQCQISDAGQQMGEAMAGYICYAGGSSPEMAGMKEDHFVGYLYSRYVNDNFNKPGDVAQRDLPVAREISYRDDLASELLSRWRNHDQEVVALWEQIRNWVLVGQEQTLERLGVRFGRPLLESSYWWQVPGFIELATRLGILKHASDGALIYETKREEYPVFPLTRPDGFPTLNLRALTIWQQLMAELREATVIHVCGDEWREHTICVREILTRMFPDLPPMPTHDVIHGMVSADGHVVSSSKGNALLIDDLLDILAGSFEIKALAQDTHGLLDTEDCARIAALGYCLGAPPSQPLSISMEKILNGERSAGILFCRALAKGYDRKMAPRPKPQPEDPSYRYVVMQSQRYGRLLSNGLQEVDLLFFVRFLMQLSSWYHTQCHNPSVIRAIRTVFEQGLSSLGLIQQDKLSPLR